MGSLSLRNLCKHYGATEVIRELSLDVGDGEFVVFVGPSGCGKSTLIRMIAGLEEIDAGEVLIDGERMNEVAPADRGLAMVFQSYALYPHMTVRDNMSFALRLAGVSRGERNRKAAEVARLLHLEDYLDHKPGQLSGGQRQRVAIGRAIVRKPKIFLFDEPLSNLDAALRGQMRTELARLREAIDATMIYVTHDQVEAMTMADRIVVLRAGRIEQVGTPLEVYRHPVNLFVAGFIGSPPMNLLPGRIEKCDQTGVHVSLPGNVTTFVAATSDAAQVHHEVTLGIRPEGLRPNPAGMLRGITHRVERLGAVSLLHAELDGGARVIAQIGAIEEVVPRQRINFAMDPAQCHVFDGDGQALVPVGSQSSEAP